MAAGWHRESGKQMDGLFLLTFISMILAIAVPNLLRARITANEAAAVEGIRAIHAAVQAYEAANARRPERLEQLAFAKNQNGYVFDLLTARDTYSVSARPIAFEQTGRRSYVSGRSREIRVTAEDRAARDSDPLLAAAAAATDRADGTFAAVLLLVFVLVFVAPPILDRVLSKRVLAGSSLPTSVAEEPAALAAAARLGVDAQVVETAAGRIVRLSFAGTYLPGSAGNAVAGAMRAS